MCWSFSGNQQKLFSLESKKIGQFYSIRLAYIFKMYLHMALIFSDSLGEIRSYVLQNILENL
jgi:hypothetical protein